MKKGKMIVGIMSLVLALGAAFAFNVKSMRPGDLYYVVEGNCVAAPCATFNEIDNPCDPSFALFNDDLCSDPFIGGQAWTTDGGGK